MTDRLRLLKYLGALMANDDSPLVVWTLEQPEEWYTTAVL